MTTHRLAALVYAVLLTCVPASLAQNAAHNTAKTAAQHHPKSSSSRPQGPCDIYAAAGDPCVAAHSTTRALYQAYHGPLYQVLRQSDGKTLDIGVVPPATSPTPAPGGYADAAAQDRFCADTFCWISKIYDQSPRHNDLLQAPRGGFSGPAMGGQNNLPLADMAPVTVMGHKVYGVFIEPGMGLRIDDPRGTAVDDQAEGQYWVINGHHFNGGCCFDYGNAEIDSRDDDNGTMETAYFGDNTGWIHGTPPGPWVMTDQENNLVGCVPTHGERLCPHLPDIKWRFVTAIAKGEPHHWTSLGGDAQHGALSVMFDGQRVNSSYDPMRKQGAILLGNGGDNSNGSQGTFYEGAVTAGGTFPSDATDQLVQANVVAAGYAAPRLTLSPAPAMPSPGLQTFTPGAPGETTVTFTNTSASPVNSLVLSLSTPGARWAAVVRGGKNTSQTFSDPLAPGASVSAIFTVTPGPKAYNGDLVAHASWSSNGSRQTDTTTEKVRSVAPVKLNAFRIGSGASNPTDAFIELYNPGSSPVDLSHWTLTARPAQQAVFSAIQIPSGTKIAPRGSYVLALSNSGLVVPAQGGDTTLHVRSTTGMSVGDEATLGSGSGAETRKITALGSPASDPTTVWQPLPDGPILLAPGSTNVPVQSAAGFQVGEKIALGYGAAASPYVGRGTEQYEVATVTAVGKPGTQAYLAADVRSGATKLQVTSVADISAGDKIRLDIDSLHHGIETVTITHVGTQANQTNLIGDVAAGATRIRVRRGEGFAAGNHITVGTPASLQGVTVSSVENLDHNEAEITFTPALTQNHGRDEWVVSPGSGLELAAPLRFDHAANLPFSDRGTGITFTPATRFPHASDEPVLALGSGLTLDHALASAHPIHAVLRDEKVTTAGYGGTPRPDQWFGGPELTTRAPLFGHTITVHEGSMVLRDASGLVVDSLNYGALVDPWAAEGYQAASGIREEGCFIHLPRTHPNAPPTSPTTLHNGAARSPAGTDTDSNCTDFAATPNHPKP